MAVPPDPSASAPSNHSALAIESRQVLADLKRLAAFGADGRGVSRPAYGAADMAARHWLAERFAEAGLEPWVDGVGNVVGRDPRARRTVLIGSHSDSVPGGGWLDGALGVAFALEAARLWRGTRPDATVGIDVVSFADEEGTFEGCIGSRAFCGLWQGLAPNTPLAGAMAAAGLSGVPGPGFDPARHAAYLEAHIEQGPRLEAGGYGIGLVEGIVGLRRQRVRFTGQADHAGTTPMPLRKDAGRALFAFCTALDVAFRARMPPDAVWNMGVASLAPGAANVVPQRAEVVVEYRHLTPEVIDAMTATLRAVAGDSALPVEVEQVGALEPATMAPELLDQFEAAAAARGVRRLRMASGAGHDAMITARVMPSAMLFVPSIGGRSHDPAENTSEADIARGLAVFVDGAFRILDSLAAAPG